MIKIGRPSPKKFFLPLFLAGLFFCFTGPSKKTWAQGLSASDPADGENRDRMFEEYRDNQYRRSFTEEERFRREFQEKAERLERLETKRSPVYFDAEVQEYIEEENLFILTGNARIMKDDFSLSADKIIINDWTQDLTAEGDVFIKFGEDEITCDMVEYNFETRRGRLYNCRGVLTPSVFFDCSLLEKLGDFEKTGTPQYYMENGTFTSCKGPVPDWKITSTKALARQEHYLHLNNPILWINRLPAVYFPYWVYPIKTERATGFLVPTIAYNANLGFVMMNEFFWVLADNADVTFGLDYYSKTGLREDIDARFAFDHFSRGSFHFKHIEERQSLRSDRPASERWRFNYYQNHEFGWNVRGTAHLNFVSDEYFDQDYNWQLDYMTHRDLVSGLSLTKTWTRASMTMEADYTKDLDENLQRDLQRIPKIYYNSGLQKIGKSILRYFFNASFENLVQQGLESYYRELDYINDVPSGSLLVKDYLDIQTYRSHLVPGMQLVFNQLPWLSFTPRFQYEATLWSKKRIVDESFPYGTWATLPESGPDIKQEGFLRGTGEFGDDGIWRQLYRTGFDLQGPRFFRIFPAEFGRLMKIKHLIYPEVNYNFVPEVEQTNIMQYDGLDMIRPSNAITYSLVNTILGKVKQHSDTPGTYSSSMNDESEEKMELGSSGVLPEDAETPEGVFPEDDDYEKKDKTTIREFARFTVSQTYDASKETLFREKQEEYDSGESLEKPTRYDYPYSDIRFNAIARPYAYIDFSSNLYLDPYESRLARTDLNLRYYAGRWAVKLGWNYSVNDYENPNDDFKTVTLECGARLSQAWSTEVSLYYDQHKDFFNHWMTNITYHSQCWSVTLQTLYRQKILDGVWPDWQTEDEYQFGFSLSLKNLGEVGSLDLGEFKFY